MQRGFMINYLSSAPFFEFPELTLPDLEHRLAAKSNTHLFGFLSNYKKPG